MITNSNEIDLIFIYKSILKHKLLIFLTCLIFPICGIIYSYVTEPIYEVSCLIKPAELAEENSISDIANRISGLNFGLDNASVIYYEIISAINSKDFQKILFLKYENEYKLFQDKMIQIEKTKLSKTEKEIKKLNTAFSVFKKNIIIKDENQDDIRISIRSGDKYFAKLFLENYLELLKTYIRDKNLKIIEEDIAFYNKIIENGKNEIVKQEIQTILLNKSNKAYTLSSNVFSIDESVFLPNDPYWPNRRMIVFLLFVLGLFVSSLVAVIYSIYKN